MRHVGQHADEDWLYMVAASAMPLRILTWFDGKSNTSLT
jgi:hypothetical protein